MKLTKFRRLRNAIAAIDLNFIRNGVAELKTFLDRRGQEFDQKNVVITQEGIYYINPGTGLSVKTTLYRALQRLESENIQMRVVGDRGYEETEALEIFNKYHLVRCNLLTHAERNGWEDGYRICHRTDGRFYHRLLATLGKGKKKDEYHQDIENQKLHICPNCLIKINSMLSTEKDTFTEETFEPKLFFSAGFQATWRDQTKVTTKERGIDEIHPKDLEEICTKRKSQAEYICESCDIDLSRPELKRFACIQYTDHINEGVSYLRFRCLCPGCARQESAGRTLGDIAHTDDYLKALEKYPPDAS